MTCNCRWFGFLHLTVFSVIPVFMSTAHFVSCQYDNFFLTTITIHSTVYNWNKYKNKKTACCQALWYTYEQDKVFTGSNLKFKHSFLSRNISTFIDCQPVVRPCPGILFKIQGWSRAYTLTAVGQNCFQSTSHEKLDCGKAWNSDYWQDATRRLKWTSWTAILVPVNTIKKQQHKQTNKEGAIYPLRGSSRVEKCIYSHQRHCTQVWRQTYLAFRSSYARFLWQYLHLYFWVDNSLFQSHYLLPYVHHQHRQWQTMCYHHHHLPALYRDPEKINSFLNQRKATPRATGAFPSVITAPGPVHWNRFCTFDRGDKENSNTAAYKQPNEKFYPSLVVLR